MSLKVKAARGGMLMSIVFLGVRPLMMIISFFLLRLLDPEDFGLIALAFILIKTANLFTDVGLGPAIIQTKEDIGKVSFYSFVIVTLFSVAFYAVVFFFAEGFTTLLGGDADLVPILRVMGILIVIDGLVIVPQNLLRRELMFRQLVITEVPGQFAYGIIAIVLAYLGFGVWSLVIANIVQELILLVLAWYLAPGWEWLKPKRWDKDIVRGLFQYGMPNMASGLLRYFQMHWDDWLVGRQLGTAALGIYSKAYDLTTHIVNMFSNAVLGSVLLPSYAKIQDDKPRVERAYLKSTNIVFLMVVPISMGIFVLGPEIIRGLLQPRWLPMVPVWQIFALYAMTKPVSKNAMPLFLALGLPSYNLHASLVTIGFMVPLVLLLIGPYGITGVAIGVSVAFTAGMLYNIYQVNRLLPGTALKTLTQSIPFFAAGGLMVLGVWLAEDIVINFAGGENLLSILILAALGAIIYIGLVVLLKRDLVTELYVLFMQALGLDRRWPRLVPPSARRGREQPKVST